ncbi:MAG: flagellar hook-length control protein FliK [Spirochaetes bacterium]|nr:flagellar hook-length control protein FliK [Spirochaetota bacterium]
MNFFQSVNLLQNTEIPAYPAGSPDNNTVKGAPFADFLNQHLNNNPIISHEKSHNIENENSLNDREVQKNDVLANNDRNKISDNKYSDTNRTEKADNTEYETGKVKSSEKEPAARSEKSKDGNAESGPAENDKLTADKTGKNEPIEQIETIEKNEKIKKTEKNNLYEMNLSVLLKDILSLLDKIKGNSPGKEQIKELKSALIEIKEQLFSKKGEILQNRELTAIFNKLKHLLDTGNRKVDIRINDHKEIFNIAELKKEISKLIKSISEKPEKIAVRDNDSGSLNKNSINQKLHAENSVAEAKDFSEIKDFSGGNKENSSNHSFQFLKKDPEISLSLSRNNVQPAAGKNNFSGQLDKIVQNAKIYIKDSKNGSFTLRLHPESLGRVNVNLNLEHGVIIGKFLVETSDAKDALMENMAAVREKLQDNGIAVGDFQVNVRDQNGSASDFNDREFPYVASGNQNESVNAEYIINSVYYHDGKIDFII